MKLQREVGEMIKAERLKKEMSQTALAAKVKSTQKRISALESGEQNATLLTIYKIASALDKKVKIELETI